MVHPKSISIPYSAKEQGKERANLNKPTAKQMPKCKNAEVYVGCQATH